MHICFFNKQGEKLSGMIFRPKARGKHPGIIICHGFASSKYTKTRLARNNSKKGFVVMIFDASGNGESDGRFEDHTVAKYLEDLRKAVEFLKRQNFVDAKRIGIAGTSLGGFLSMAYASKYRDVKAIIPVASPYRGHNGKIGPFSNKNFMNLPSPHPTSNTALFKGIIAATL